MVYLLLLETEEDRERFQMIYEENYLKMYHVAFGFLKQQSETENIVHEAFLALAERFEKYSHLDGREMTGLCVSIVKNKAIDSIRKANHYSEEELENLVLYQPEETNPDKVLVKNEQQQLIQKALLQISEVFRETLVLKYYYDLNNREIAKIQGVSVKTVEMRLYRGKQKLREIMHGNDTE